MTAPRLAVIDLGTNTFHLLIVEANHDSWQEIYRQRVFVNLAEDGIKTICNSAIARGLEALRHFSDVIKQHDISDTIAVGTAALREAENSEQFIRLVHQELGITVTVIDGQKEAEYINAGVMQVLPPENGNFLIMDIGGGSVEFIISSNRRPVFAVSYPIGVAVLYDMFHHTEPMSTTEHDDMVKFLNDTLGDLDAQLKGFGSLGFIGASGTFEAIESALQKRLGSSGLSIIRRDDFMSIYNRVMPMTYAERQADESIPLPRARYIVVALKLIQHVLFKYEISSIRVSGYALKEGIVSEWQSSLG